MFTQCVQYRHENTIVILILWQSRSSFMAEIHGKIQATVCTYLPVKGKRVYKGGYLDCTSQYVKSSLHIKDKT